MTIAAVKTRGINSPATKHLENIGTALAFPVTSTIDRKPTTVFLVPEKMFSKSVTSILLWSFVFMFVNRVHSAETSTASDCKDECDKEATKENIGAIKKLAQQYLENDKWADAVRCFTKLIDFGYLPSASLSARAQCLTKLGKKREAEADLAMIKRLEDEAERRGC